MNEEFKDKERLWKTGMDHLGAKNNEMMNTIEVMKMDLRQKGG